MNVNGYVLKIRSDWNAFNEGSNLDSALEYFTRFFDLLPSAILADQIYKSRCNVVLCRCLSIRFNGKRLSQDDDSNLLTDEERRQAKDDHVDRIVIEGNIGTLKTKYGMAHLCTVLQENQEAELDLAILSMNMNKMVRRRLREEHDHKKKALSKQQSDE